MKHPIDDNIHFGEICESKYPEQKMPIAAIQVTTENLAKSPNMFFYGRADSLRDQFADEFVRRILGIDYVNLKVVNIQIDGISLNIRQCVHYFEIDFYVLTIASNSSILFGAMFNFIKQVVNQRNLIQAKHVFLLKNVEMGMKCLLRIGKKKDNITTFVEDALKNLLDKKSSTTLFVLVGTKLPYSIKNRCLSIRCAVPIDTLSDNTLKEYWDIGIKKLIALRSIKEVLHHIKEFVHIMILTCPFRVQLHKSLFLSIQDVISHKRISNTRKNELYDKLLDILCTLDHNIMYGSKPNIHYESCLLCVKTEVFM
jgi:hypothetical protein